MKNFLITVLDLGSSKISASMGKIENDEFDIIGTQSIPSKGIEKGFIVDKELFKKSLEGIVEEIQKQTGEKVVNIYAGISTRGVTTLQVKSKVDVEGENISKADIIKAIDMGKTSVNIPHDMEIIDYAIEFYTVDDNISYENVIGQKGKVLSISMNLILGIKSELDKFKEAIEECNLKLEGFLVNVVAGEKVLLQGKKGMNTKVLVDIGAETTDIVIFSNGVLKQIINKPVGGNNITKDLSICAEMSMDEADNLKKIYSKNYLKLNEDVKVEDIVEIGATKFSKSLFYEVVQSRLDEIFKIINNVIKNTSYCEGMCSIIIYGDGVIDFEKIEDLAGSIIESNVTIATRAYLQMKDTSNITSLSGVQYVYEKLSEFEYDDNEIENNLKEAKNIENKTADDDDFFKFETKKYENIKVNEILREETSAEEEYEQRSVLARIKKFFVRLFKED